MNAIRDRITEELTRDRLLLEVRRASRPFLALLALLALGIASLALLVVRLHVALPWQDRYEIRVAVDDASGVVAGNHEIRISGVTVGRIAGVRLERGEAVITAQIEPKYGPLYRDARLRLRPRTPLEDMYLNVEDRGSAAAGRVPDGGLLQAGRTRTPVHIREVLDVFNADVRPRLKQAIDNAGRGLGEHGDEFRAALVELAPFLDAARRLAREYAIRGRRTRRLVHNFRLVSEELAHRDEQVARLTRAAAETLGTVASVERPLAELIDEMAPTLRQLPESFATVRATADDLDAAFTALRPAARALPEGLSALERLGPELQAGAAALRRPLPALTGLVRSARPVARALGGAFGELSPQAPRLDRITAAVVPCELVVQKFLAWTLSVSKYYDAYGVRPRGQSVVSSKGASAGRVPDANLTSEPSCAKGGPRK